MLCMQAIVPRRDKMNFNIIVVGYGGQGVLTLAEIIAKAAFKQGYEVKQAELHGLAQRGGSLQCHIRFGKDVFSPLIRKGNADLIISLEALEALRACYFANEKTKILVNSKIFNFPIDLDSTLNKIKEYTKNMYIVDADNIVRRITGDITSVNTFILAYSLKKNLLPLKKDIIWQTLTEKIRKEFLEENKKVFEAI